MKTVMKNGFLLFVLFTFARAQDGTFVASAERTTVAAGEQFQVSFTFSGSDANGISNFRAPQFEQLVVLNGPFTSQNFQWVNGKAFASFTYSYSLYAREPRKYTIGSASIDYKGKTLKTDPLQIEVVKGKPQARQHASADEAPNVGDNVLLRVVQDKQRVKQGEQVTLTYKLYFRTQVTGYDLAKAPVYQGFWSEEIEQPQQPVVTTETYEGKQYRVAVIRKTALFPTQSGKLTVQPLEIRCAVQVQSRKRGNDLFDSFFNDPFFSRAQTVNLDFKSNPLTLTVDPLPGNVPDGYSGAVGEFSFNASVDKKDVTAGDPITLRLSVSGSGNLKLLTLPKPGLPTDMEGYEPKISEEISREGGTIQGKKTAEYLLIPRNAGQRVIESIPFTYFDLRKNSYVTLRSPKFEFNIMPGKDFASGGASIASKSDVRLLGEDIRFLKLSSGEFQRIGETPLANGWFYAGLGLPPLAFLGALVYRKRMERISGDLPGLRFQKAGREASKRLKLAKKILAQGDTESYHAEVSRALLGYLEDKLRLPKSSLTIDQAVADLTSRGVPQETIDQLKSCVERAEFARFAPSADSKEARREILDAAAEAIGGIERSFSRDGGGKKKV